jgi:predicted MPP superfamily phosphohydrolase
MIGPLIRARRRSPRGTPLLPDRPRRLRNVVIDLFEFAVAPLGRWKRENLVVERVEVHLNGLAPAFDGYRIAFLSDLHASPLVPHWWLEHAVSVTQALGADLIALGGDYITDDADYLPDVVDLLSRLSAPDGVVGVLGNHDHYVGASLPRAALLQAGVRELFNAPALLERGGSRLAVTGVGDLIHDVIDFQAAVAGVPDDVPRIALSHDPDVLAYWPPDLRLDLMLAGHTHGGQAYLPVLGPPFVPSQFGFRYLKGLVREGERQVYVSRGVGAVGLPIRWGCPPEVADLVLRAY